MQENSKMRAALEKDLEESQKGKQDSVRGTLPLAGISLKALNSPVYDLRRDRPSALQMCKAEMNS